MIYGYISLSKRSYTSRNTRPVLPCIVAGTSDRAVKGVGLRPLACRDCGFESHRGHGCLSVVECCALTWGRGFCDELATRTEEFY